MANINTKVINIARLSPISKIIPTNTYNTVNGKAVADYVGERHGGTNITEVDRIINAKMEELMQYLDDNFIRGKVIMPDELPPEEERPEDFHYFLIPDENEKPEPEPEPKPVDPSNPDDEWEDIKENPDAVAVIYSRYWSGGAIYPANTQTTPVIFYDKNEASEERLFIEHNDYVPLNASSYYSEIYSDYRPMRLSRIVFLAAFTGFTFAHLFKGKELVATTLSPIYCNIGELATIDFTWWGNNPKNEWGLWLSNKGVFWTDDEQEYRLILTKNNYTEYTSPVSVTENNTLLDTIGEVMANDMLSLPIGKIMYTYKHGLGSDAQQIRVLYPMMQLNVGHYASDDTSIDVDDNEMVLNITTPSNSFELNLFDYVGGSDIDYAIIDWGDGSDTIKIDSAASSLTHTYSTAGSYQLKITGKIKWKGKEQWESTSSLSKCLTSIELSTNNSPIGDIGTYGFAYCTKLTTIPNGLFNSCTEVTDFLSCFYACESLQSIPEGLFDACTEVTSFSSCFGSCSSLQSVPSGLFDNCTKVTTFGVCFDNCSSLQSIPEGLFDNCPLVTSFFYTFNNCPLQTIPQGLFNNCPLANDFDSCFYGAALQAIPERLFDNNTKVTNFNYCFYNCTSVTSKLPELWISHSSASGTQCFNYCDKAPNYEDAYNAGWADDPVPAKFDGMILNITTPSDNFALNLFDYVGGSTVDDATINWGDGSGTATVDSTTKSLSHIYSTAGNYQLKIKGTIKWKGKNQTSAASSLSKCLTSIELSSNNNPIVDIGQHGFRYFNKLTTIPAGLFDNCTTTAKFNCCFLNCSSLQSIPTGLFDKCTNITSFEGCFAGCTSLQSIPAGLFDKCTKVGDFATCFENCKALQAIPNGLFDNCTKVDNFNLCFSNCSSLQSIPNGLFDNSGAVLYACYRCFNGCSSLQSIPAGLFDNCTEVETFDSCFQNCSSLQSIPAKLFDKCTVVTGFVECFSGCTSLRTIPEGLFNKCVEVTNFSYCFNGCTSLETIPTGLFDNCTQVTDFSYCFNDARIKTIPEGLFDSCINVDTFSHCFDNCIISKMPEGLFNNCTQVTDFNHCFAHGALSITIGNLKTIPSKLFYNNTQVTNFSGCFEFSFSLQSIPKGLFDNNKLVTDFSNCFDGCSKLTTIPDGLFDNCTQVTDFGGCFMYCVALTSIPQKLFDKCKAVTNFRSCFQGCDAVTSNLPTLWISHPNANGDMCFLYCRQAANYQAAAAAGWVL